YRNTPYSCFPDKLGLAEANWAKLDRVKLWFDTHHNAEIQLITPSDPLQPVWGNPTIGYYFFDQVKGQVFFKSGRFLNRDIRQFREFSATEHGAVFGSKVSRVVPGKDDAQLLVFEPPYYYLLTASRSGQLDHRVIAAETLDGQLSAPPVAATDKRLIPLRVVDSYDSRRILRTGFYDGATQTYIAFLSSLLDGGPLVDGDDGSRLRLISELVRKELHKGHLPVHKVVRGQRIYYLMYSQHSGNLYWLSTNVRRPGGIQQLSSGFQVIRPADEQRTVAEMANHPVFTRVQAHSASLLADTPGGYQLWIPDKAWDTTRVVSENLTVESGPFAHWQLEATGQTVAKSNDTLSVRQFTP
ncbi:hypothetical protein, partial [Endozoicomonas sp. SESOKO3]|uniref:hypothetical protein n=1 Tax=Endozoicomonas sp. SESOKO3 TaxID=2828744 RepID=UPI0021489EFE